MRYGDAVEEALLQLVRTVGEAEQALREACNVLDKAGYRAMSLPQEIRIYDSKGVGYATLTGGYQTYESKRGLRIVAHDCKPEFAQQLRCILHDAGFRVFGIISAKGERFP